MTNKSALLKSITAIVPKLAGTTVFLGAFWSNPVLANTLNFEQIYIFGDSNSDQGNVLNSTGGFPPEPYYYQGRFTNGLNWVDYLSSDLGLNPEIYTELNSGEDGVNFTFGGATTGDENLSNLLSGGNLPGLQQQVDYFADVLNGGTANPDALYLIWVGPNDYVAALDPFFQQDIDPTTIPTTAVNNFSNAISKLNDLGASNIVLFNEADVAQTPFGRQALTPEEAGFVGSLIQQQNILIEEEVNQLNQANPDLNLITFDTEQLFQDILNNPSEFGLTNVTDNCSGINFPILPSPQEYSPCSNPGDYLFWDNQHQTTAAHRIIADRVLFALESELTDSSKVPEPSIIAALGFFSVGLMMKKKGKL